LSYYQSWCDLQGDVVFEDEAGYTEYAIFTMANLHYWAGNLDSRVTIDFYVSSQFYKNYDSWTDETYWDPIPSGLISWTGDWIFNHNYDDEIWQWGVSSNDYYCNGPVCSTTSSTSQVVSQENSVNGDWRDLGYVRVTKSVANQIWEGLFKLHIDNGIAKDYRDGIRGYDAGKGWYTLSVLKMQFKLVYTFQLEWYGWQTDATRTHILGDGVGDHDSTDMPLVEGIVYGII